MKLALAILAAIIALALTGWLVTRNEGKLEAKLPARFSFASLDDALLAATKYSDTFGGQVCSVLGTGSMAPFIPASPGKVAVPVAYAVMGLPQSFESIKQGELLVYRPTWGTGFAVHLASQKTTSGWIMSGLANAHSESAWRVTQTNYVGTVKAVFVCPTP